MLMCSFLLLDIVVPPGSYRVYTRDTRDTLFILRYRGDCVGLPLLSRAFVIINRLHIYRTYPTVTPPAPSHCGVVHSDSRHIDTVNRDHILNIGISCM